MYTFITGTLYRPINSVQINQIRHAQLFCYFFLPSERNVILCKLKCHEVLEKNVHDSPRLHEAKAI